MGVQARSWKRGRACEQIVELPEGGIYVCGKFTRDRGARCDEHQARLREAHRRGPEQRRRAS